VKWKSIENIVGTPPEKRPHGRPWYNFGEMQYEEE
jgi:hypothetical protein